MTNAVLNLVVVLVLAAVTLPRLRGLPRAPLVQAALVLGALTVVFDSLMIGAGLYEYAPDKILGVRLWRAPLEDLAYPLAAVLLMPALWTALGSRSRSRSGAAPAGRAPAGENPAGENTAGENTAGENAADGDPADAS